VYDHKTVEEIAMDLILKGALVAKFGSQVAAARELGITERRLSRLINGHETPKTDETELFRDRLGVDFSPATSREPRAV
jgi:hypothetical protein